MGRLKKIEVGVILGAEPGQVDADLFIKMIGPPNLFEGLKGGGEDAGCMVGGMRQGTRVMLPRGVMRARGEADPDKGADAFWGPPAGAGLLGGGGLGRGWDG